MHRLREAIPLKRVEFRAVVGRFLEKIIAIIVFYRDRITLKEMKFV